MVQLTPPFAARTTTSEANHIRQFSTWLRIEFGVMKYKIEDPRYTASRAILEVDYCLLSWYPELTTGSDKVLGSPTGTASS